MAQVPLYWGYIPSYSNMFIGIFSRSQVSIYRTIGPLVVFNVEIVLLIFKSKLLQKKVLKM